MSDPTGFPGPFGGPPPTEPPMAPAPAPLPFYVEPPAAAAAPARRRGRTTTASAANRPIVVMLAFVAMIAGSVVGVAALTQGSGAGSPEGAVDQMFVAIGNEDAIGVLNSLAPGEREALLPGVEGVVGELQRLGLLSDFSLSEVPGVDFHVEGVTYATDELAPGIVSVEITGGTFAATALPDEVPIGEAFDELDGEDDDLDEWVEDVGDENDDLSESVDLADVNLSLVAIDADNGWHVSLGYSIAEWARTSSDLPLPDFSASPSAIGADTPEGAVEGMLEAAEDLDVAAGIGMLPPDEMAALYDYAPLFLDDADDAVADLRDDGFSIEVHDVGLSVVEGSGPVRRVALDSYDVEMGDDDERVRVQSNGDCVTYTETSDGDEDDPDQICLDDLDEDDGPFAGMFVGSNVGGTVTVVEHGGRWYLSPIRTMFDSVIALFEALEPGDIEDFFGVFLGTEAEMKFEAVGCAIDENGDLLDEDCDESEFDDSQSWEFGYEVSEAEEACWAESDAAFDEARTEADYNAVEEAEDECLLDAVEAGELDRADLPTDLLFPECAAERDSLWDQQSELDFDDPRYNRLDYQADVAWDECLETQDPVEGDPASEWVDDQFDLEPCYQTYVDLSANATEEQWAAADEVVAACVEDQYSLFDEESEVEPSVGD